MASIDIPMSEVMSDITMAFEVTGVRAAKARMWLGCRMLVMAAHVIGCNVEIVDLTEGSVSD